MGDSLGPLWPSPIAEPMRQSRVLRNGLPTEPIHLDVVDRRVIDARNVLATDRAGGIPLEQLLFQHPRKAPRLIRG
jgi:hypothetical protein